MTTTPSNAAADTIVQLRSQDTDIQTQIDALTAARARIAATIASLDPVAEWDIEPDPEPDPAANTTAEAGG